MKFININEVALQKRIKTNSKTDKQNWLQPKTVHKLRVKHRKKS